MEDLMHIERESTRGSSLHKIDGRIKIIITFLIIIFAVNTTDLRILLIMEAYLLILILISKISLTYALKRLILILPFGGFVAIFQPFIRPGDIIWTGPLGLTITEQGIIFGALLLAKITVCVTTIIFLSSSTSMQDLIGSARKLGIPHEFAMLLNLTVRYLFFFYDQLERIRRAQTSRCFDIWNKKTSYKWRVQKVGETITMMFLRAYEQGESVYLSMLSRGYTANAHSYTLKSEINYKDIVFIGINISFIIGLYLIQNFYF
ncbi:cobalt ECF transporter T component CbiQ [Methanobacterium alcaliphilum]|uniref:cobalt ECF transporter T component CbiQ n=1 Tax=Methanobacterium alcaliphilum TaxID=392018 RepID=UPI00200A4418|nr:cobalt ECF transporter T component CbiQ [Methanobacterium alcaliphilum]MCK9152182.1 cobalt ECF transporter T component CbiQ [Methanobacterium alcaliphilum]